MSTTTSPAETRVAVQPGGGFILDDVAAAEVFTPEDFSEEHRQIQATAARFLDEEVLPQVEALENKEDAQTWFIHGPWSEPSYPVYVPPESQFFVRTGNERRGEVSVDVYRWYQGVWVNATFKVKVGDPAR